MKLAFIHLRVSVIVALGGRPVPARVRDPSADDVQKLTQLCLCNAMEEGNHGLCFVSLIKIGPIHSAVDWTNLWGYVCVTVNFNVTRLLLF